MPRKKIARGSRGQVLAEVGGIHRSTTHEFGSVRTYHRTEIVRGNGDVDERYESLTEIMARLDDEGWETISVVPDQYHTWIDIYVRRLILAQSRPINGGPGLHVAYQAAFADGTIAKGRATCKSGPVTTARLKRLEAEIKESMESRESRNPDGGAQILDVSILSWQPIDGERK